MNEREECERPCLAHHLDGGRASVSIACGDDGHTLSFAEHEGVRCGGTDEAAGHVVCLNRHYRSRRSGRCGARSLVPADGEGVGRYGYVLDAREVEAQLHGTGAGTGGVDRSDGVVVDINTGCSHNYGKNYSCGCGGGYGNYVQVNHSNGLTTFYAHCQSVKVSVGQHVKRGQAIAEMGSTGSSTGAHLHFEVIINGVPKNPMNYV